jgi:hypothetical protein
MEALHDTLSQIGLIYELGTSTIYEGITDFYCENGNKILN